MSTPSKKKNSPARNGGGQGKSGKPGVSIFLIGGGVILLLLAVLFIYFGNQPPKSVVPLEVSGAPALLVNQERIDFGDVKVDTPVTATFEISNVGDQPLRFSEVPKVEVVEGC
jgi:hypothetical protein